MSAFAPMTADILWRKGEARPLDSATRADSMVARREPQPFFNASNAASKPERLAPSNGLLASGETSTAGRSHRIALSLTESEFKKLGIAAVKKGINRQELFRQAVDFYLEQLAKEYRSDCSCISTRAECCGGKAD